jgi:hypothetical protein
MANNFVPDLGCATPWQLIVDVDLNCPDDGSLSEIQYVLLADSVQYPTAASLLVALPDWTMAADWTAFIDNAEAVGVKAKQLVGVGNVATGAASTRQMPGLKQSKGEAVSTLSFNLKSLPDSIYTFLNKLRSSSALPYIWLVTVGGKMFGSPSGINLDSMEIPFALAEGADSYEEQVLTMTWKSKSAPLRIATPV